MLNKKFNIKINKKYILFFQQLNFYKKGIFKKFLIYYLKMYNKILLSLIINLIKQLKTI